MTRRLTAPVLMVCALALSSVAARAEAQAGAIRRSSIPTGVLAKVRGCWQVSADERWIIGEGEGGTAKIQRVLLGAAAGRTPRGSPQALRYRPRDGAFAFTHPGRRHEVMQVFTVEGEELVGSVFSRRHPSAEYHWTGSSYRLHRCAPGS